MTTYAPPPPDAPPMGGPDDQELLAMDIAAERARRVAEEVYRIEIREEAHAKVRAAKVANTNFAEQFLNRAELLNLTTADPLIAGVLPRHSYAILRGRDHSFKSFVAIDWALCLATGKRWQGHAVDQVRVLYIAGEGAHGLRARVDAWEYAWNQPIDPDTFVVRTTAVNMHQPGPAYDHLIDYVHAGEFGLVVIDTLRRVSGNADGNSSEMGAVIDNIDRLKQATASGTVLTVAHTDKGDHDTRGYSGIEDDADVVWAAKRDDLYLSLELTKMKDGPDGRRLHLAAERTLNSLTLAGLDGPATASTTESQTKILDALRIMPDGGVTGPDLMATAGLGKATFYRALKDLGEAGHIAIELRGRTRYYSEPGLLDGQPTDPTDTSETDTPGDTHA